MLTFLLAGRGAPDKLDSPDILAVDYSFNVIYIMLVSILRLQDEYCAMFSTLTGSNRTSCGTVNNCGREQEMQIAIKAIYHSNNMICTVIY